MPVNLQAPRAEDLLAIDGVRIGVVEAGVRKANRKDLTVFLLDAGSSVGGVFTQNRYCAAPVQLCRQHLSASKPEIRALVINTGIANAGTGAVGLQAAQQTCDALAAQLGVQAAQVLPFSTGVIMENLPVEKITAALPAASASAQANHWAQAPRQRLKARLFTSQASAKVQA